MATVQFFEKPGCRNNTRQKAMLRDAGHEIVEHNLLTEPWTKDSLRPYFGQRPVADWFNRAAPRIKSGEIVPESFSEDAAIAAMLADPLLIRRPLMAVDGRKETGFDVEAVDRWIGLAPLAQPMSESCPRDDGHHCG